jgi:DNA-binding protein WhiA
VAGRVVVEAEVELGSIARRLRKDIFDLYGYNAVVHVLSASGIRKTTRYVLRVANDGEALARQTGLLDLRGRPVRGLPAQVVGGSIGDAEAAWRGAFLAHGSLTEPGRSSALEVSCPGPEAALALVGAARRLGISAKAREVRGADRVVVRDGEAIGALLTRMGAQDTRLVWGPLPPVSNGRWKYSATQCPTIWPRLASYASSTGRHHWRNSAGWPIRR